MTRRVFPPRSTGFVGKCRFTGLGSVLTVRGHDDHASGRDPERIQLDTGAAGSGPPDSGPSTGAVPGDRGVSRWRLRNWRLRSKLAVVLLVPALTTATLAGLRLNTQLDDVELFGSVQRELAVSHQAAKVENALQVERDWAVQCVAAGRLNACPEHAARTGLTDVELSKYKESGATASALSAPLRESFTKSLQSLEGLGSLRVTLLSTKYPDVA